MDSESIPWKGNIPIDLVKDILLRLPAKSVVRSMCTCKRLYSLVKSPEFVRSRLNRSKTKDHGVLIVQDGCYSIFCESDTTLIEQESGKIPFPVMETDLYILGSCRGLVLVKLRVKRGWLVLLWNPLLEKVKLIDPMTYDKSHGKGYVFALGFHEASNDYLVVRIRRIREKQFTEDVVDIYSLTRNSWHRVDKNLTKVSILPTVAFPEMMATYINGVVHWLAMDDLEDRFVILSFDFDNEVFRVIELPDRYTSYDQRSYALEIKNLNGNLALFGVYHESYHTWVMKNYPLVESWTDIGCLFEHEGQELWPMECTEKRNCIFRQIISLQQDMIKYYNAKEDKIYELEVVAPYICPIIVDFVDCLVLIDAENEVLDDQAL